LKPCRSVVAVDALSFTCERGVLGLLGPNGAGKTTLLRMLATVLGPDSGTLRLLGLDPADRIDRLAIRRKLGYLPQQAGLYSGFTGFDLVDYVAVLKEWNHRARRHDEVRRVFELVDLTADMHRRIRSMSGGMQRRVAIAAALIGDPELLVLDEPTNGLDPAGVHWLRRFLRLFAEQGRTVLVSSHVLAEVAQTVDRVVIIDRGRLVQQASMADVEAMASAVTRVRSPDAGRLLGLLRTAGLEGTIVASDELAVDAPTDRIGELAAANGIVLHELTAARASLEDVFLQLTDGSDPGA
jgi:ABC-2 type transport system ATP-binding protein